MSVKHLLFQQSNVRSGLRAEITAHKRISDSYVHRRLKQRKYDLPDNWHVNFKNKCLYCQQPVDGIRGMKGNQLLHRQIFVHVSKIYKSVALHRFRMHF